MTAHETQPDPSVPAGGGRPASVGQSAGGGARVGRMIGDVGGDYIEHIASIEPQPTAPPVFPQFVGVPDRKTFVGRVDELDRLRAARTPNGTATVVAQAATGLGGVGKTALAVEYCHRHRAQFDVVRWLVADRRDTLTQAYLDIAPAVGVNIAGLSPEDAIGRVRGWLETTPRSWLLVFDNADDHTVLDGLLPDHGNGQVLITSRDRDWPHPNVSVFTLGMLDLDDAVELLGRRAGDAGPGMGASEAEALVERLGRLALAIEQARAYMRATGWSFRRYSELVDTQAGRLFRANKARARRMSDEDVVVATVWDTSIDQAVREAPAAGAVLAVLAFLGSKDIPHDIFGGVPADGLPLALGTDPADVDEALGALERYHLVDRQVDPDRGYRVGWSVHRVVQDISRLQPRGTVDPRLAWETALRLVAVAFPLDFRDPALWPQCARLLPHALAVTGHAELIETAPAAVADLLSRVGLYLWTRGDPRAAQAYLERALSISRTALGEEHPDTLTTMDGLASTLDTLGNLHDAHDMHRRALAARRRVLGDEHPDTLSSMATLALTMRTLSDLPAARDMQQQALAARRRVLGDEHPETLTSMNDLALTMRSLGDLATARDLNEHTLAARRRVLGPDHPSTLTSMNNLAETHRSLGDLTDARSLHTQTLEARRRVLGRDHPSTLTSMNNLAETHRWLGNLPLARDLHQQTLEARRDALGQEHPSTLTSMHNLAETHRSLGDLADARSLHTQTLEARRRVLGEAHSATLTSMHNLAETLRMSGEVSAARDLHEQTFRSRRRVLGDDHPDTLVSRANLALTLEALGDRKGAKRLRRATRRSD